MASGMPAMDMDDEKGFVEMMGFLKLDGQWQQRLKDQGFVTASDFYHSVPKEDLNAVVAAFVEEGVDEPLRAQARTSVGAGRLRRLWQECSKTCVVQPVVLAAPVPAPAALPVLEVVAVPTGKQYMAKFKEVYPSEYLTAQTTPSSGVLTMLKKQVDTKSFEWVPWRRLLSEAQSSEWQEAKKYDDSVLALLAAERGLGEPEVLKGSYAAAAWQVEKLLSLRAVAYAMLDATHLVPAKMYVSKFLTLYSESPSELAMRRPSAEEAEVADKKAWTEICRLVDTGFSLDDATVEVVEKRNMLYMLLQPRLRAVKTSPVLVPAAVLRKPVVETVARGVKRLRKGAVKGACFGYNNEGCKKKDCKYKHCCSLCGSTARGHTAISGRCED